MEPIIRTNGNFWWLQRTVVVVAVILYVSATHASENGNDKALKHQLISKGISKKSMKEKLGVAAHEESKQSTKSEGHNHKNNHLILRRSYDNQWLDDFPIRIPLVNRRSIPDNDIRIPLINKRDSKDIRLPLVNRRSDLRLPLVNRRSGLRLPLVNRRLDPDLRLPLVNRRLDPDLRLPLVNRRLDPDLRIPLVNRRLDPDLRQRSDLRLPLVNRRSNLNESPAVENRGGMMLLPVVDREQERSKDMNDKNIRLPMINEKKRRDEVFENEGGGARTIGQEGDDISPLQLQLINQRNQKRKSDVGRMIAGLANRWRVPLFRYGGRQRNSKEHHSSSGGRRKRWDFKTTRRGRLNRFGGDPSVFYWQAWKNRWRNRYNGREKNDDAAADID